MTLNGVRSVFTVILDTQVSEMLLYGAMSRTRVKVSTIIVMSIEMATSQKQTNTNFTLNVEKLFHRFNILCGTIGNQYISELL